MQERAVAERRVGARLQEFRKRSGLSQRKLGPLVGASHATISKWETGRAPIDADLLAQLGEVLGVDPCDFLRDPAPRIAIGRVAEHGERYEPSVNLWPTRRTFEDAGIAPDAIDALLLLADRLRHNGRSAG